MKTIKHDLDTYIGENAEVAVDYVIEQENNMIARGGGNAYFGEDYAANMLRFKREAIKKFGVRIILFGGKEMTAE